MKIVCDSNMPYAAEAFRTLGDVVLREGRAIKPADVRDADMLITRSTTKVTRELLSGSRVRFYGSAVIGTDHIDISYLAEAGIPWSGAPGCNAESVANYLVAALLWLAGKHNFQLAEKTLGIIGVGNVGKKVYMRARALGLRVVACDPPRRRDPADVAARDFVPLEKVLTEADIVTCHVPLTRDGQDKTWHMLDATAFGRMRRGAIFVNAARGEILKTDALLAALDEGRIAQAVMDTWEGEPCYRADMLARAAIATPHIAGHSYEGKVNGTMMVYEQACKAIGVKRSFHLVLPPPPVSTLSLDAAGRADERADEDVLREAALAVYDIMADDRRLRESCTDDPVARARAFDKQRKEYPMRREFGATQVRLRNASDKLTAKFRGLGFQTK